MRFEVVFKPEKGVIIMEATTEITQPKLTDPFAHIDKSFPLQNCRGFFLLLLKTQNATSTWCMDHSHMLAVCFCLIVP